MFPAPGLQGLSQETIEYVLSHVSNAYDRLAWPVCSTIHLLQVLHRIASAGF